MQIGRNIKKGQRPLDSALSETSFKKSDPASALISTPHRGLHVLILVLQSIHHLLHFLHPIHHLRFLLGRQVLHKPGMLLHHGFELVLEPALLPRPAHTMLVLLDRDTISGTGL